MMPEEQEQVAAMYIKIRNQAIAEEREACAKIAESMNHNIFATWGVTGILIQKIENEIAAAIRART